MCLGHTAARRAEPRAGYRGRSSSSSTNNNNNNNSSNADRDGKRETQKSRMDMMHSRRPASTGPPQQRPHVQMPNAQCSPMYAILSTYYRDRPPKPPPRMRPIGTRSAQ